MRITRRFRPGGRTLTGLASAALACAAVLGTTGPVQAATANPHHYSTVNPHHYSGRIHLTAAEAAAWRRDTATAAGRERILSALQSAFGPSAVVGAGPAVSRQVPTRGATLVSPDLSYGITGDHFWVIASYLDIVDGAIDVGVAACRSRLPEVAWVCNVAGSALKSWARGWGSASNHGVWAAIYWWPPHWTGGRW
jgi:hypothetical protein